MSTYSGSYLDRFLYALAAYATPVLIALATVIALSTWQTFFPYSPANPLALRIVEDPGQGLAPAQARNLLAGRPAVQHYDTHRSEQPVWFQFGVEPTVGNEPIVAEFPSRHAIATACWNADTLAPLGDADREHATGSIKAIKSGFALTLGVVASPRQVLCRASFIGPARLTAFEWPAAQLQVAAEEYHRNAGLLDGGLLVLAIFMLVTAAINRNSLYVMFAAWLVVNLRVAELSVGWDLQWLGMTVPHAWILYGRPLTLAAYYVLTLTLFCSLLKDDIAKVGYAGLLRLSQLICVPLLLMSLIIPYKTFLPIIWIAAGLNIGAFLFILFRILSVTRSKVAIWYGASICITLFASMSEVFAAAFGFTVLIGSVNSVTAALSSSLLAALAIAEQMRQEHKQKVEAQAELEHTYEAMPIGLFTLDLHGNFLSKNPALLAMLGRAERAPSVSWGAYFDEEAWQQLLAMVQTHADGELEINGHKTPGTDSGKRFLIRATLARGKIEGSLEDITEKSKAIEDLRFMANNDPLTKVYNRRGIEKVYDGALRELKEVSPAKPLALAYLDLDRFKLINDLYGHGVGDEVLKQVCARMSGMLTDRHCIGRVGGDEFVIVMPDTTMARAAQACQGIVSSISDSPYRIGHKAFHVRVSIGLIEVAPETLLKDALSSADRACREAKASLNSGLVVYEKNAEAFMALEAELALVERLANGSILGCLYIEMQPIMSLKTPSASHNFEVLLRARDHDGTVIPAERIIGAAESSGQIGVIDRWVMTTTLAWMTANYAQLGRTQFVCMNLSGASLNDERFAEDTFAILEQNLHVARRLCLEITESVALQDLENTRGFIDRVRSYGVKVALDDFGAGYTSFSYLKELPADVLKIDGNFIVNINAHPANVAIVEAIVSLAVNLGMKTIAEWAEDCLTVQTLAEIGVDYVQGYAVARPGAPSLMLGVESSTSFIRDPQVLAFVETLGKPIGPHTQLVNVINFKKRDDSGA
jgi:diguanylate cyclase (GGDEF)-like protein/PAS domain S-box-containing protein